MHKIIIHPYCASMSWDWAVKRRSFSPIVLCRHISSYMHRHSATCYIYIYVYVYAYICMGVCVYMHMKKNTHIYIYTYITHFTDTLLFYRHPPRSLLACLLACLLAGLPACLLACLLATRPRKNKKQHGTNKQIIPPPRLRPLYYLRKFPFPGGAS